MTTNNALIKTSEAMTAVRAMLAALGAEPGTDRRALAVAKTQFETAFLWAGNAAGGAGLLDD